MSRKNSKIEGQSSVATPMTNRGSLNSILNSNTSINTCIDYFKVQFIGKLDFDTQFIEDLLSYLHIDSCNFENKSNGKYPVYRIYDEDTFIFGNSKDEITKTNEFVWYLELKGHACRMFEQRCINDANLIINHSDVNEIVNDGWLRLFEYLDDFRRKHPGVIKFKRIDTTLDDFKGIVTLEEIEKKIKANRFITRFVSKEVIDSKSMDAIIREKNGGKSITFGSKSTKELQHYNKLEERKARGYDVNLDFWCRHELRHYGEHADWCFNIVLDALKNNRFPKAVAGLIKSSITYLDGWKALPEEKLHNRSRMKSWSKWDELLSEAEKSYYFVSQQKIEMDITMTKKKQYLIDTCYMVLATTFLTYDDPEEFMALINLCLQKALSKFKTRDYCRLIYDRIDKGKYPITFLQCKRRIEEFIGSNTYFGEIPESMLKLINYSENELQEIAKNPFSCPELIINQLKIYLKSLKFIIEELDPIANLYFNDSGKSLMDEFYQMIKESLDERKKVMM